MGCIEGIMDDVIERFKRMIPDDLPEVEKARRRLAMAGRRYYSGLEMGMPSFLLNKQFSLLDKRALELANKLWESGY